MKPHGQTNVILTNEGKGYTQHTREGKQKLEMHPYLSTERTMFQRAIIHAIRGPCPEKKKKLGRRAKACGEAAQVKSNCGGVFVTQTPQGDTCVYACVIPLIKDDPTHSRRPTRSRRSHNLDAPLILDIPPILDASSYTLFGKFEPTSRG